MVAMLNYKGNSHLFKEEVERHQAALDQIYRDMLGKERFGTVEYLATEHLFHSPTKPQRAVYIADKMDDIFDASDLSFLFQAINLVDLDEDIVSELDRRVLAKLGYDPTLWINRMKNFPGYDREESVQRVAAQQRRRAHFGRLDDRSLAEWSALWDRHVAPENTLLKNYVDSIRQYRVKKIPPQPPHAELLRTGSPLIFSLEGDSYMGSAVLSPPGERIEMDDSGKISLKDTSTIVTVPLIVLSDEGVEKYNAPHLEGSGIPPHLTALVHEFNHFVNWSIQRYPLTLASGLFQVKAMRKGKKE